MKYRAVYAGDTGGDYGLFHGGNYATVEEAVQAVKKGLESCYCHAAFGYVWDEEASRYVVMFDGGGDIIYDARAEEAARANGHGTPFVRKYLTGVADPAKWDAKPDWIGETIYEKKEAKAQ